MLSPTFAPLLRQKRKYQTPTVYSPPGPYVDVSYAGSPPSPDCLGQYNYLEEYNDCPVYRRNVAPFYRCFRGSTGYRLNPADTYTLAAGFWTLSGVILPQGTYSPSGTATGTPVVSAQLP
jgi:hypothetical protein